MRNFLIILVIVVLIPIIWMIGIQGLTFKEMLIKLGIKQQEE